MSLDYIVPRKNGKYSFRITVPKAKRAKFGKREFWVTLGTKDRKEAIVKAAALLDQYMKLFKADEISDSTPLTMPLIQQTSERLGIQYHTPEAIEAASVQDYVAMMSRGIEALEKIKNPDIAEVAAIGGAVEPPALNMLELFDRFVERSGDKFLGLDTRAREKKVNRYKAAATDFVAIMGEIDVVNMTSKEAFDFAAKLTHRVANEEIELETAQKKLQHVGMFVRKVFQSDYPTKTNPFEYAKIESNGAVETGNTANHLCERGCPAPARSTKAAMSRRVQTSRPGADSSDGQEGRRCCSGPLEDAAGEDFAGIRRSIICQRRIRAGRKGELELTVEPVAPPHLSNVIAYSSFSVSCISLASYGHPPPLLTGGCGWFGSFG